MKKIFSFLLLSVLLLGGVSCDKVREIISGGDEMSTQVGGYSKPHNLSDEEMEIFEQATSSLQGVEYKPMNVSTQIVAGVNYRFLCKARRVEADGKRGKRYYAAIVVHKPLAGQGDLRILSIEKQSR